MYYRDVDVIARNQEKYPAVTFTFLADKHVNGL